MHPRCVMLSVPLNKLYSNIKFIAAVLSISASRRIFIAVKELLAEQHSTNPVLFFDATMKFSIQIYSTSGEINFLI